VPGDIGLLLGEVIGGDLLAAELLRGADVDQSGRAEGLQDLVTKGAELGTLGAADRVLGWRDLGYPRFERQ
jgi:hypothetical protein